jgi:hypothetical protein
MILTEHAENMDEKLMKNFLKECKDSTSDKFVVVPGLEFSFKKAHILGLGLKKFFNTKNVKDVIGKIHRYGGLAVLAHPRKFGKVSNKKELEGIDGVEVWSFEYDGLFPRPSSIDLMKQLNCSAFCGLDLHSKRNLRNITTVINSDELNPNSIMENLKQNNYFIKGTFVKLSSKPKLGISSVIFSFFTESFFILRDNLVRISSVLRRIF